MNPFEGYKITSAYGWRIHPISKQRKFHAGIDLVKPHKAPIYSFTDGVVQFAEERRNTGFGGMGIVVAVKDSAGHLHCYAHLDSASVRVGQVVKWGQEVGKQGSTGTDINGNPTSTGSHLHYEIRPKAFPDNGWLADPEKRSVDPTVYLQNLYKEAAPVAKTAWEKEIDEAVAWAKGSKISDGTRLTDGITRQEAIVMNYRLYNKIIKEVKK